MAAFGLATRAADPPPVTRPAPGLTNEDAIVIFGGAVMDCLQSRMGGQTIQQLGDGLALKVAPATPGDRVWAPRARPETPVWVTDKLGYLMNISELTPERCEVTAIQLPVDRTLNAVVFALTKTLPDFKPVHVDPGYNPIVYQLELVDGGTKYIVHMEGAEPGAPGHELRFSLLTAYVLRQSVTAGH